MSPRLPATTDSNRIRVGVCGSFQSGKSLLINCLLGREVALSGEGMATTRWTTVHQYAAKEEVVFRDGAGKHVETHSLEGYLALLRKLAAPSESKGLNQVCRVEVSLNLHELDRVVLVDTPGFGHDDLDDAMAAAAVRDLDLVLLVQPGEAFGEQEIEFLKVIQGLNKPCVIVQNCRELRQWCPELDRNRRIHAGLLDEANASDVTHYVIGGSGTFNFLWHWFGAFPDRRHAPETIAAATALSRHFPDWQLTPAAAAEEMIRRSRVPVLRSFVFPEPEHSVGVNAYCLGRLHRAVAAWSQKAQEQIQQIKETIKT